MKQRQRKQLRIGDIVEIKTPHGFGYLQLTHSLPEAGELVRVFPGLHDNPLSDLSQLADTDEQFVAIFPLSSTLRHKLCRIVGNEAVPKRAIKLPLFRSAAVGPDGNYGDWWLWDGKKSWRVGSLKPEYHHLPLTDICSAGCLAAKIVCGWKPEQDVISFTPLPEMNVIPYHDLPNSDEQKMIENNKQKIDHYCYFRNRLKAKNAAKAIEAVGLNTVIRRSAYDDNWLLLATHLIDEGENFEQVRSKLEAIAVTNDGEYDGWELQVS